MQPLQFGNWQVTDDGILYVGENDGYPLIEKDRLAEPGPGDRSDVFDWLVHLPTKTWVSMEDVYALNTAFFYAMGRYGIQFPSEISIEKTLSMQHAIAAKRK